MNRAIYGGSFDPVHNGHVNMVRQMKEKAELDEIIVMPTAISPFKKNMERRPASAADRLEMCRLAFSDFPFVTVSGYEISLNEVSYTVNTMRHFCELYPDDRLFFIMGSDMLLSFDRWYCFKEILSMCTLLVASREDMESDIDRLYSKADELSQYGTVKLIRTEVYEMSSSLIREKIMNNQEITCYMPENVVKYIAENNVYTPNNLQ
ncbi:MAG: nicotinate (nicotinamide) nucleotide adenylyltransferase [Oscillospiraceae bacterium]|nr:nicotinate (nicotinamide) nucleotide adenylyltransferase [Oscillospiraceae bacterium]